MAEGVEMEVFREAYRDGWWGGGSGPGSAPEATVEYRRFLQDFLDMNPIRRVLDVGCGDWQSSRLIDWAGVDYTGVDCVPEVVEADAARFGSGTVRFLRADILQDDCLLPPADLVIVKDVLQHWSEADIRRGLARLAAYPLALITNCARGGEGTERAVNEEILTGGFRPLDLRTDPFRLPVVTLLRFGTKRVDLWVTGRN